MDAAIKDNHAQFIPRQMWGADPVNSRQMMPLKTPVENVVAAWTDTAPCFSLKECMSVVKQIQLKHMAGGLPDIAHNFLIGADGRIYEGRGWMYQGPVYPPSVEDYERLNNNCVEVAFIDWRFKTEPSVMSHSLNCLVGQEQAYKHIKSSFNFYVTMKDHVVLMETFSSEGSKK